MAGIADFITLIRGYTGFTDTSVQTDAQITGYVRSGEARINESLRIADMVKISTGALTVDVNGVVAMPADWIANQLILVNGVRFDYKDLADWEDTAQADRGGLYTTSGMNTLVDPTYSGDPVVSHYFGDIPALAAADNWVNTRYPQLLTHATMIFASLAMIEDDRGGEWETLTANTIQRLNDRANQAQGWGTKISRPIKKRSFG